MKYRVTDFTVEEKLKLLCGKDFWRTEDLNGKLYEVTVSDGPVGVRKPALNEEGKLRDLPSIAYPATEVLSQTWNLDFARQMGECLGDDCIELGVDILLAPGVNIKRNPLCGRNFEYVSEDPLLAGLFGKEYINGVQSRGVGTSLKHYCANNSEFGRLWVSSEIDERTLREIYLQPFRIACQANPTTIMCSYNLVNGQRMSEHKKLYDVLRKEFWNEDGLIMSDWGAVKDHVASVKAGLDLRMPFGEDSLPTLMAAYERGELKEEEIDRCVERIFKFIQRCEENKQTRKVRSTKEERLAVAQKIAEEGVVLLKNDGVLPLKENAKIAISGLNPEKYYGGRGSSRTAPTQQPKTLAESLQVEMPACVVEEAAVDSWEIEKGHYLAFEGGYDKDVAIVICGDEEEEGYNRETMKLPYRDETLILQVAEKTPNTVVVLRYGAAVDTSAWADKVAAIVWAGYGGQRGNEALARVLSGKVNPSGKLTESFAKSYEDYPCAHTKATYSFTHYAEGLAVGYRYFDEHNEKIAFPFGHGLSYSTFAYTDLQLEEDGDGHLVKFTLKNQSDREGAEVSQVYVREVNPRVVRPYKELKAFSKVNLKGGESKQVCLRLAREDFAYYSVAKDCWTVTPGYFEIFVAASAQDIRLKASVFVK